MKAVRFHQVGGPEVLQYEDVPMPEPGAGQVRLKLEAIGVNFIDNYLRLGQYKTPLPAMLGQEGAGVVDAVGPEVDGVKVGDRVVAYWGQMRSYAEYAVVPAWLALPIPPGVRSQDAAAVILQGMTAHYLARSTYPLKPGDTALIHAAGGGTGALLVQIAKLCGARVLATAGSEGKLAIARESGADEVIHYTQTDFEPEVKRLTGGKGVNVVYDSVGKDTFDRSLNCLRPRGYMVLFGQSSGPVPPLDPQVLNAKGALFLTRPTLGYYVRDRTELAQRAGDLFTWIGEGKLKVRIAKTFPLAQAADAQRFLASRAAMGKVLLVP
ncbi:MAG: quinone oxidoreductase [Anaerolineae bacterium]